MSGSYGIDGDNEAASVPVRAALFLPRFGNRTQASSITTPGASSEKCYGMLNA